MKINEAVIFRENINDLKLKEILDDNIKFDRIFQVYVKLHTKSQHFKSQNPGRLISEEIYQKVVL